MLNWHLASCFPGKFCFHLSCTTTLAGIRLRPLVSSHVPHHNRPSRLGDSHLRPRSPRIENATAAVTYITVVASRAQTAGSVCPGLLQKTSALCIETPKRMVIGLIQTRPQAFPPPIRRKGRRSKLQIDVFRCVGSASSCQMRTAPHGRAQARGSIPLPPPSFLSLPSSKLPRYITLPPLGVSHRPVLPTPRASQHTSSIC